jgi:hypothetical protein
MYHERITSCKQQRTPDVVAPDGGASFPRQRLEESTIAAARKPSHSIRLNEGKRMRRFPCMVLQRKRVRRLLRRTTTQPGQRLPLASQQERDIDQLTMCRSTRHTADRRVVHRAETRGRQRHGSSQQSR